MLNKLLFFIFYMFCAQLTVLNCSEDDVFQQLLQKFSNERSTSSMRKVTFLFPVDNKYSVKLANNDNQFVVCSSTVTQVIDCNSSHWNYNNVCNADVFIFNACTQGKADNTSNNLLSCYKSINTKEQYYVIVGSESDSFNYTPLLCLLKQNELLSKFHTTTELVDVMYKYDPDSYKTEIKDFGIMQDALQFKLTPCSIEEVFGSRGNVEIIENKEKTDDAKQDEEQQEHNTQENTHQDKQTIGDAPEEDTKSSGKQIPSNSSQDSIASDSGKNTKQSNNPQPNQHILVTTEQQ